MKCEGCDGTGLICDTNVMSGEADVMVCTYCFGRKVVGVVFEVGKWYRPKRELRMRHDGSLAFSPGRVYKCEADNCGLGFNSGYESYAFHDDANEQHWVANTGGGWFDEFTEVPKSEALAPVLGPSLLGGCNA